MDAHGSEGEAPSAPRELSPRRQRRSSGRAGIIAVAGAAGVSPATVSRVMNGRTSVDPALATRVRDAAATLGYAPDGTGQSLARGRTGVVGLLVPDLGNPVFQSVLRGLSSAAGEQDHRVLIADSHELEQEEPALSREVRRRCDGLVLCSPRMADDLLRQVVRAQAPVVVVNRQFDGLDVPTVSVNHAAGMHAIADHLSALGHRRVAYLSGPATSAASKERFAALTSAAVNRFDLHEITAGAQFEDGFRAVERLTATGATAVVGYNDLVAYGAMARLRELGIAVPDAISVTGFDDIPFARYATPPLTTVAVPQDSLGREAWRRLWSILAGEVPATDLLFDAELVVRKSTGPAPSPSE